MMALTSYDGTYIAERLHQDGLQSIQELLRTTSAVIAGSYTLPPIQPPEELEQHRFTSRSSFLYPSDIDIWIPYGRDQQAEMGRLIGALMTMGYDMRHRKHSNLTDIVHNLEPNPTIPDAYKRIDEMIQHMTTLTKSGCIRIQILCMSKKGGSSPDDIIKHFDLNLNRQFYDGHRVWAPPGVRDDIGARRLTLNMESDIIQGQSFPEWRRTVARILKYAMRGYRIDPSIPALLLRHVPDTLRAAAKWCIDDHYGEWNIQRLLERGKIDASILPLRVEYPIARTNVDGNIQEWNRLADDLHVLGADIPVIRYSAPAKATKVHELLLGMTMPRTDHRYGDHTPSAAERARFFHPDAQPGYRDEGVLDRQWISIRNPEVFRPNSTNYRKGNLDIVIQVSTMNP